MNIQLKQKQQGISIIEVLIAMLILAVGLLGMASLQVRAVTDTSNASYRSIAIYYANDMADRMRANSEGLDNDRYDDETGGSLTANCLAATGCSEQAMANHDKAEWLANIAQSLPAGTGDIDRAGDIYRITVSWSDRVDQQAPDASAVSAATSSVVLNLEP